MRYQSFCFFLAVTTLCYGMLSPASAAEPATSKQHQLWLPGEPRPALPLSEPVWNHYYKRPMAYSAPTDPARLPLIKPATAPRAKSKVTKKPSIKATKAVAPVKKTSPTPAGGTRTTDMLPGSLMPSGS